MARSLSTLQQTIAPQHPVDWPVLQEIASNYGSPCYIYTPAPLRQQIRTLRVAMKEWGDATIAYSVKTNSMPAVLADVRREGCIAEAVSRREIEWAMASGFSGGEIIFNGPAKTDTDIRFAIDGGVGTIGADSLADIDLLEDAATQAKKPVPVGIRICPPRHGGTWSRFGLNYESGELQAALERVINSPQLKLVEIHFHLGTQVADLNRYAAAVTLSRTLWDDWGFENVQLNIGGGFPYAHDKTAEAQPFDPSRLVSMMVAAWGPGRRPRLQIEPGRFVVAPSMAILCRVLSRQQRPGEPDIIVLDSGTNHNVMAAFFEHRWLFQEPQSPNADFRLCGPLCMEDDTLSGTRSGYVPKVGSLALCENAGAYSISLARDFIQARPPIVRLAGESRAELLESREALNGYPRALSSEGATR